MTHSNRLIMQFEQLAKKTNRDIINAEIEVVTLNELKEVAELIAQSRAAYLKCFFDLAKSHGTTSCSPTDAEMQELQRLRGRFRDLVDASKALETAILRDYLDLNIN